MEVETVNFGGHPGINHRFGQTQHSGEEIILEYFPCPFCFVEVEVPFLCSHLQDEHCFDKKNAVCPLCADNLGKDMIEHFRFQHSNQLTRMKSSRTGLCTQSSSAIVKESNEVDLFSEGASHSSQGRVLDPAPDPLLSQFMYRFPLFDTDLAEGKQKSDVTPTISDDQRPNQCVSIDMLEQDLEERLQRIEFVKELLLSTIF